jgi:hypothetical protein
LVNADVSNVVSDVLKDGFIEQLCSLMMIVAHEQLDQAGGKADGKEGDASVNGKEAPDQDGRDPGKGATDAAATQQQQQQQQQDGAAGVSAMEVDGGGGEGELGGGRKSGSSGSSSSGAQQQAGTGGGEGDAEGLGPGLQAAAEAAVLQELDLVLQKLVHAVSRKVSQAVHWHLILKIAKDMWWEVEGGREGVHAVSRKVSQAYILIILNLHVCG